MNLDAIGRNIRKFRKNRNLRQEDLAEIVNLSPNYIGMIERGEKIPALDTFIDILNALGVSADMVLTDVVEASHSVRTSLLVERMDKISEADRKRIYEVIEVLLNNSSENMP